MKKHSILYIRKFEFPRENFIKSFANSPFFETINVAESVEQALELIKTQKPSIVITGVFFKDGTAEDIIKGIETTLTFRPHIIIVTVMSCSNVYKYYKHVDHIFCEADFNEEILATYFEKTLTAV